MDESVLKLQQDLIRLRQKMVDLQKLDYMTPESFGTYQQTILQIWQEADRRRQTCITQAETLRRQAAAAEAQAGAFSVMSSIMYNVVNGFVEAGEKRIREEAERAAESSGEEAISSNVEAAASKVRRGKKAG